jgi:hypothetical protein
MGVKLRDGGFRSHRAAQSAENGRWKISSMDCRWIRFEVGFMTAGPPQASQRRHGDD